MPTLSKENSSTKATKLAEINNNKNNKKVVSNTSNNNEVLIDPKKKDYNINALILSIAAKLSLKLK